MPGALGDTIDGNGGNDVINTGNGNDAVIGGAGNDNINTGGGNDLIIGVNPYIAAPGVNEIDTLVGGGGNDTIALGNNNAPFYDDNNVTTQGTADYARIQNFNKVEDVIQLFGAKSNYRLGLSPVAGISGTAIFRIKPSPEPQELIAIVEGVALSELDLNASYFTSTRDEIAFGAPTYRVTEDGSTEFVITLTRTIGNRGAVSVTLNLSNGTATAGQDYTGTPINVTFNNGEYTKTVSIPLLDDSILEGNETVNLRLTNPTGGAILGSQSATILTIVEEPVVSFGAPTFTLNEDGTGQITLNRTGSADGAVSVSINLTNGTALSPSDYNNAPITVSFATGETSKTVSIPIINDLSREGNETFNIALANPTSGAIVGAQNTAIVTIADDDIGLGAEYFDGYFNDNFDFFSQNQPVLRRTDRTINFVDGAASWNLTAPVLADYETYSARWRGFINIPTTGNYTFFLNSDDASYLFLGNATQAPSSSNATINNGGLHGATEIAAQVFLQAGFQPVLILYGDNFTNNIAQFSWASTDAGITKQIVPESVLFTPNSTDIPAFLSFGAATYSVNEQNGSLSVTIERSGRTTGAISAVVNFSNGTAIAAGDYNNAPITVNFASGETSKTISIPIVDDTRFEANETFNISLGNLTGGATLGTRSNAAVTIVSNDLRLPGQLAFTSSSYSVSENGTPVNTITIDRTGGSDGAVSVVLTPTNGTATTPGDYNNTPITVNFLDGETSKTVTIPIVNDNILEPDETVNLTLTNPGGGATLATRTTATLTIINDDTPSQGILSFSNTSYSVGEDGIPVAAVTINRAGGSAGAVSVRVNLANGSATAPSDYNNAPITINFATGETSKTVTIPIVNDTAVETTETINLSLSNPTGGATLGAQTTAILNIIDDETVIDFSAGNYTVRENGTAITDIVVTRRGKTDISSTFTLSFTDGTAIGCACAPSSVNNDFHNVPFDITFAPGETSKVIPVSLASLAIPNSLRIRNDAKLEGDETFTINLSNGRGAIIGRGTALVTIKDDETAPAPLLSLTFDRDRVNETAGNSAVNATITRSIVTSQALVVTLTSSDTTEATSPRQVIIPANQASATFAINAINDNINDGPQLVNITAAATGYPSVSRNLTVTDAPAGNLADLVISTLTAATPLLTGALGSFTYRVTNSGIAAAFASASLPIIDRVYISTDGVLDGADTLLGEFNLVSNLPVAAFYQRTNSFFIPKTPGQYNLIVVTDVNNTVTESSEGNNSRTLPIVIQPAYRAIVSTDVVTGIAGQSVILTGRALSNSNNAPMPYEFVTVAVRLNGTTRELTAFTDKDGNFTRAFNPLPGEAGNYTINAYFPGNPGEDITPEDSFKLLGMRFDSQPLNLTVLADRTLTGTIVLKNLTDTALNGLVYSVEGAPAGWTITGTTASGLAGNAQNTVNYSINIPNSSTVTQDTFDIKITSTQGATAILPITVNLQRLVPNLVASTNLLTGAMLRGEQTIVEFEVTNTGGATAQNISLQLSNAPWLRLVSPNNFNLGIGETTKVSLLLSPDNNLPLTQYNGNIVLDAVGNNDLTLPFRFQAVSSAVGNINVNVVNELFFFAQGSPKLAGATVILKDYFSGEEINRGITTNTGSVSFTGIKEGFYKIAVTAENHDSFEAGIQLEAGETETVNSFLSKQTVKYVWNVTPTTIEDRYDITIETVFETDVPVPVVVLEPGLIDLQDLQVVGQVLQVNMTATNHGLIAANNLRLDFGSHPFYRIEPLLTDLGTLAAKSSITVPVRITRIGDFPPSGGIASTANTSVPCSISASLSSSYFCGGIEIQKTIPIPIVNVEGNCGGNIAAVTGGVFGGRGGPGGVVPVVINLQSSDCDPCTAKTLEAILACAINFIPLPDPLSCLKGTNDCLDSTVDGVTAREAFDCTVTALDCVGKLPGPVGTGITIIECLYDILTACDELNGGSGGSRANSSAASTRTLNNYTSRLNTYVERLQKVVNAQTFLWGDAVWFKDNDGVELANWTLAFQDRLKDTSETDGKISSGERSALLALPLPGAVTATDVNKFIDRWNRSIDYWNSGIFNNIQVPAGQSTDFIAINLYRNTLDAALDAINQSRAEGFANIYEGAKNAVDELRKSLEGNSGGVCARVRLQINQEAVMTRDAFLGSLEIDNGGTSNLTNISVNLQVRDANGNVVNNLFGITDPILRNITSVTGNGILTADNPATPGDEGLGSAQWTFIPSSLAASEVPTVYTIGGSLSYVENGKTVTVPLLSTPVTVYPQAELVLDYFQERNVYGDDPFTTPVEISVPFSLGVLVRNQGKGEAKNLQITSAQPKIIDNEKGLLINFEIIGSEVNGNGVTPSLSVNFGNIAPGGTAVADWLLKSSLQGKFIDYEASFRHVNGLGNAELSLIKAVNIRELTRKVQVTQPNDDGLPDFLVNGTFDSKFYPDILYFSNGTTAPVTTVDNGSTDGPVTAGDAVGTLRPRNVQFTANVSGGWTYFRLSDPGNGQYKIQSIRRADNTLVSLNNVWTTDRTFPGTGRPVYENILHFLDNTPGAGARTYTLIYEGNPTPAGITINQSNGSTSVTEGGAGDSYTLVLNSQPRANVTLNLSAGTGITLNNSNLVFTPANWNVPQTVAVSAVDDTLVEGDHTAIITHSVTSTDSNYNGLSVAPIRVNIADNDRLNLPTVTVTLSNPLVTENGTLNLIYTFTRTGNTSAPLSVGFSLGGTAIPGSDYAISVQGVNNRVGQINFPSGASSVSLTLDPTGDNLFEGDETVILSLNSSSSYQVGTIAPLTGNINNDDGDESDNRLNGSPGNDNLNGALGKDTMSGGLGNDIYWVDDPLDLVRENPGEGTDGVRATIDYTLGDNLENLSLIGRANLTGTGNALNNNISGNPGNNLLTGLGGNDNLDGGLGIDTLIGGPGNDSYTVDNSGDVFRENPGEGIDSLRTPFTFDLTGTNLENLNLTGTANVNGTGDNGNNAIAGNSAANLLIGNAGNDTLRGNAGNDTLRGGDGNDNLIGGSEIDSLIGGPGDDIYVIDTLGDTFSENPGEGTDTIQTPFSFNLTGTNLENITLTGTNNVNANGDSGNNNLTGNSGVNILGGGAGNDTLNAGAGNDTLIGGEGNDNLTGGTGLDSFVFNLPAEARDLIADFNPADDTIALSASGFGLPLGVLNGAAFRGGAGIVTANAPGQRLIYNTSTGALYFDADGNGSLSALQLATLNRQPSLTSADFLVI